MQDTTANDTIDSLEALRALYAAPHERAVRKQISALDRHCRDFIARSPFLVMSTANPAHQLDASPRGGAPGFVKVTDDGALLIPDAPGNNRLDSFENIVATGRIGLLFLIPGFDETLRVNGRAALSRAPQHIAACTIERPQGRAAPSPPPAGVKETGGGPAFPSARRAPVLVVKVDVEAAYLHCAKAFLRSRLWDPASRVERTVMPTIGQIIAEQSGLHIAPETREEMERRYAPDL